MQSASNTHTPSQLPRTIACVSLTVRSVWLSLSLLLGIALTRPPPSTVPASTYSSLSLSYIGAMLCSNLALSFMSYPAQTLAKSCKLIPVMIARIVINRAKYEVREYVQVALITGGISVYMTCQPGEMGAGSKGGQEGSAFTVMSFGVDGSWFGLALCLAALALDGYTVTQHTHTHSNHVCQLAD